MIVPFWESRFFRESLFTLDVIQITLSQNKITLQKMILSKSKQSWHWWVAVSHKMDLKEIRSSDFIINLDTLHFFWPIFIFRTENTLGRRGRSPTNDKGFLKHKTSKNFLGQANFFISYLYQMRGSGITIFKRRK